MMQRVLALVCLCLTGCLVPDHLVDALLDHDGDGVRTAEIGGDDCNDDDPQVRPGQVERCGDGLDNDCNGATDDAGLGEITAWPDRDGDGFGLTTEPAVFCAVPAGWTTTPDDCNDRDDDVHPTAEERCNGVDDDCDGATDEGVSQRPFSPDLDGDGFGDRSDAIVFACVAPQGHAPAGTDCDDLAATTFPGAPEVPYDGIDQACDGGDDFDLDGDGHGGGPGGADCDDDDPQVHPGAPERWYDSTDQDCNPATEWDRDADGLTAVGSPIGSANDCDDADATYGGPRLWYVDLDGDGWGLTTSPVLACLAPPSATLTPGDCDDTTPAARPGLVERCGDGVDNDCDGGTDDRGLGEQTAWRDADGDGFGDNAVPSSFCQLPAGWSTLRDDCDDARPEARPQAPELCNGLDDDCDGLADDGVTPPTWAEDADGDGFGGDGPVTATCVRPDGHGPAATDCDDADPLAFPGAVDAWYDGLDTNCDGVDDFDQDGDGLRRLPEGPDCDDEDPTILPGAPERWYDGIDQDCDPHTEWDRDGDGLTRSTAPVGTANDCNDDDATVHGPGLWYVDVDQDGYGLSSGVVAACVSPPGLVARGGDCDDDEPAAFPTNPERCGDGIDNDCDGLTDDLGVGDQPIWRDADADGYGDAARPDRACELPEGFADNAQDCDDQRATTFPSAAEACNGRDDDCDTQVDEGLTIPRWSRDQDGDGFGGPGAVTTACTAPAGQGSARTDCNDARADVHPGAGDAWYDGLDADCDGADDYDRDADGYRRRPEGADCDDTTDIVFPGASEVWYDGIDQDCDPNTEWDRDADGLTRSGAPLGTANDCDDNDRTRGGPTVWYTDFDRDGWGTSAGATLACTAPAGTVDRGGDCVDTNTAAFPGAVEVCDALDNDCDGATNEGVGPLWYDDADGDGRGRLASAIQACTAPFRHVAQGDDCDDADPTNTPGRAESCDARDNNCDGAIEGRGVCGEIAMADVEGLRLLRYAPMTFEDARTFCVNKGYRLWDSRWPDEGPTVLASLGISSPAQVNPNGTTHSWLNIIAGSPCPNAQRWYYRDDLDDRCSQVSPPFCRDPFTQTDCTRSVSTPPNPSIRVVVFNYVGNPQGAVSDSMLGQTTLGTVICETDSQ